MTVSEAIKKRQSIRAYQPREVEQKKIERILEVARFAPSGVNTQPWQVAVVRGESKQRLQQKLETAMRDGEASSMSYQYYPEKWLEPYKSRRLACGLALYGALGIGRDEKQRMTDQQAANFRAFDAPVMLLFFMDAGMSTGSYIDYGMFMQSIMLTAVEEGLATCPQASLANYPHIVKQELGIGGEVNLICGMALGYADENHVVNSYRTGREEIDNFAKFYD